MAGGKVLHESLKITGLVFRALRGRRGGERLVEGKEKTSPPKEIQALRKSFDEMLAAMGVTLVVLIDDLDRCVPETAISTLEAIRLFLFPKNTALLLPLTTL